MRISKENYEEYQQLKEWYEKEEIKRSARETNRLEDDIDYPIRNCVAMLALLGCEPTFSCCGFDYEGQPIHKSHQYGEPYIRMKNNIYSVSASTNMLKMGWWWNVVASEISLQWHAPSNPHWRSPKCIHFPEEMVGAIIYLESFLFSGKNNFRDVVVLSDTNKKYHKYWQYPAKKEDWVIKKEDIIQSVTESLRSNNMR